jgi:N-[(2S)-2-amino-2-carboxyethyl]-L-glutamate dehydrogenase
VSVSALMIRHFDAARAMSGVKLGIIGWGPIGRSHARMFRDLYGPRLDSIRIYDIRGIDASTIPGDSRDLFDVVNSWEEAYRDADVFITCTASSDPYIDAPPRPGSLHLNVSLRDYRPDLYDYFKDGIVVDDWDEVCRENTDIERMALEKGLTWEQVTRLDEIVVNDGMKRFGREVPVMFNPMGMAIFDVAIANHYLEKSEAMGVGLHLQ